MRNAGGIVGILACGVAVAGGLAAACGGPGGADASSRAGRAAAACPPFAAARRGEGARPRQMLQGVRTTNLNDLAVSPDGRYVATTEVKAAGFLLWDASTRALLRRYRRGNPAEEEAPFLRWEDDSHVFVGSREYAYVSDLKEDEPQPPLPRGPDVFAMRRGPYRWLACAAAGCELRLPGGKAVAGLPRFEKPNDAVWGLRVSGDGATVVLVADDKASVWQRKGERFVAAPDVVVPGKVLDAAVGSSGGPLVVAGREKDAVMIYLVEPGGAPRPLPPPATAHGANAFGLAIAPDGRHAVGIVAGSLVSWDLASRTVAWEMKGSFRYRPQYLAGGRQLAVQIEDSGLFAVDAVTGRTQGRFGGSSGLREVAHTLPIDGDRVVAWGRDVVTVWSLKEARRLAAYAMHGVSKVELSPAGDLMVWSQDHHDGCAEKGKTNVYSPASTLEVWNGIERPSFAPSTPLRDPKLAAWPPKPPFATAFCHRDHLMYYDVSFAQGRMLVEDNGLRVGVLGLKDGVVVPLENAEWAHGEFANDAGALLFSRDGKWVAAARIGRPQNGKNAAVVGRWDAATGKRDAMVTDVEAESDFNPQRANPRITMGVHLELSPNGGAAIVVEDRFFGAYRFADGAKDRFVAERNDFYLAAFGNDDTTQLVAHGDASFVIGVHGEKKTGTSDYGGMTSARMSPDGSYVAATSISGALVIWDTKTAAVRAALADFDDEEWIISTPGGAYAGTAEVADRVGWVFDEPREHFGFEQFASFHDPDTVRRRLGGEIRDTALHVARPPRVDIGGEASGGMLKVKAHATAVDRVDVVRVFVEGRPAGEQAMCRREGDVSLDVPLVAGNNRVNVVAFDDRGYASNAASLDVVNESGRSAKPNAYVVAVGVNEYRNLPKDMWLGAANADARGIAAAFKAMEGKTYGSVTANVITDAEATPSAIKAALAKLSQMKPDDVGVVFFAGHGFKPSDKDDMVFVTGGVRLRQDGKGPTPESLGADAVGWRDIAGAISAAKGRVLVLLDACHSGHVSQELVVPNETLADTLVREKRAGAVVFTAAKGRQFSLEPGTSRALVLEATTERKVPVAEPTHGFFTAAILDALAAPETDRNDDGAIQLSELIDATTRRVRERSRGEQTPWVARRDLFGDFTVAGEARAR